MEKEKQREALKEYIKLQQLQQQQRYDSQNSSQQTSTATTSSSSTASSYNPNYIMSQSCYSNILVSYFVLIHFKTLK
jgi:hypothetical protein